MNKLMKLLSIGGVFMALTSTAAWADDDAAANSQPTPTQARIRLYGQNQKPTIMTYRQNDKKVKINVGGGFGEAFFSMVGAAKSTSLGIPKTAMVDHMKQYNGILSKVVYHEYAIPTNTPITVHNNFIYMPNGNEIVIRGGGCQSDDITFTAEAGKDYEVIPEYNSSACGVILLQVNTDGSTQEIARQ